MACRTDGLSQWTATVSTHLGGTLSKPMCGLLAMISFAMVVAQSCGTTSIVVTLAGILTRPGHTIKEATLRQRVREFYYEAADKAGTQRQAVDVTACFPALLRWILAWWPPTERQLLLVMDATTFRHTFTVLALSVIYRGCAIPIAWTVLPATKKGAWKPHWIALFATLTGVVPAAWRVVVCADRGLYAKWLFRTIVANGWHPFLRINVGGNYRVQGEAQWHPLRQALAQGGTGWAKRVTCFSGQNAQLPCTLLVCWEERHTAPWLIVTDLAPEAAHIAWYGWRMSIESGFKDLKRGGWHWEQTKMTDPARASRLWLAMAVATVWVVSVGGEADATLPVSTLDALPELHIARRTVRTTAHSRPRMLSCFRRGMLVIHTTLIRTGRIVLGRFHPTPWPETLDTIRFAAGGAS